VAGIGVYLKRVREQNGYTLEQMNHATNIHLEYLQAIENEQFELLPSPFYAKAFLRTYAKSLGVDARPLLEIFEREIQPQRGPGTSSHAGVPLDTRSLGASGNLSEKLFNRQNGEGMLPAEQQQRRLPQPALNRVHPQMQPSALIPQGKEGNDHPVQLSSTNQHNLALPPIHAKTVEQTFVPRRIALEIKQKSKEALKNGKKSSKLTLAVAISALLLIGAGAYFYWIKGHSPSVAGDAPAKALQSHSIPSGNGNALAANTPILQEGEISNNPYEGQLYTISNVDKLQVVLKGENGESRVIYAPTYNDTPEEFTLKVGQEVVLDTKGKDEIWFRLGTPSNVQITVNGQEINTEAQDTVKSYRVKISK
jgi:cytoskeleton protein RodZ